MTAGVMVLVAAAAVFFVLAPLRRPAQGAPPDDRGMERERLAMARSGAAQALRDLELDRATGKLSDADYAELAARSRDQALAALGRLDAPPQEAALSGSGSGGAGERFSATPEPQGSGRGGGEVG